MDIGKLFLKNDEQGTNVFKSKDLHVYNDSAAPIRSGPRVKLQTIHRPGAILRRNCAGMYPYGRLHPLDVCVSDGSDSSEGRTVRHGVLRNFNFIDPYHEQNYDQDCREGDWKIPV